MSHCIASHQTLSLVWGQASAFEDFCLTLNWKQHMAERQRQRHSKYYECWLNVHRQAQRTHLKLYKQTGLNQNPFIASKHIGQM